jgi:uncharacterized membrane protein
LKKTNENTNNRYAILDQIRGFAVLLMIIFHSFFDLTLFKYLSIDFQNNAFWWGFPRLIVFLFLLCVGISSSIAYQEKINWKKFWIRLCKITFLAVVISVTTYILFPTRWIYFGTLHCIAICSLWLLPFLRIPKISLLIGLALIIPSTFFKLNIPWFTLSHKSMDYIAPFPWFGVALLGIFAYSVGLHKIKVPDIKLFAVLKFMGKHSLIIYLIHQPILYGTIYLLNRIF